MRPKTRGEPLTDQSQKTLIPDAVGEKTSHSPPISSVEEFAEIRIDDAVALRFSMPTATACSALC